MTRFTEIGSDIDIAHPPNSLTERSLERSVVTFGTPDRPDSKPKLIPAN